VKELVLVAEDSTAWGRDLGRELPELLEALAGVEGDQRLRLMYAYPNRFPWGVLPLLREHPRVIPYLDIPVQHAATPVLRAMRRAGSGDQVRRTLDKIRAEVPGITLRSTVLVGFPGETDADVEELVAFVRAQRLGRLGAFTYSPEEGTPGFELADDVPESLKEERYDAVIAARDEVLAESQAALVGTVVDVLVDERRSGWVLGRTPMDAPEVDLVIAVEHCDAAVGERVPVRVTSVDDRHDLVGSPVREVAR
jgi:ribosomal protein S12 methylthiotransferase